MEQWESRERRKAKDRRYAEEEEVERLEKMEREKKCLAAFLEDYDDEKDDHRFYKVRADVRASLGKNNKDTHVHL